MTIPVLLIGILIAMGIFTSLFWAVAQGFQARERERVVLFARVTGVGLVIAALWAAALTRGLSRLFPLFGMGFGVALVLALPFA